MAQPARKKVLDGAAIDRSINRLAKELLEREGGIEGLCLIGIRTRGVPLARRIAEQIDAMEKVDVPVGVLDITLYRDDFTTVGSHAVLRKTEIPFEINERRVLLVDDVLYTGRTIRAALDGLVDFGRPKRIELAVLVDRGLRELPIRADYIGKSIATTEAQVVEVKLKEVDREDSVFVSDVVSKASTVPDVSRA